VINLKDKWGRCIDYLRISLTDKCNLKCVYCMPEKETNYFKKDNMLSNDEMLRIIKLMAQIGISKVRFTGGEPLLREGIEEIIKGAGDIPTIKKGIFGGMVLAFGRAFGEFGATMMVSGNIPGKTQNIPMAMYYMVEGGNLQEANIILVLVILISTTLIFMHNKLIKTS